MRADVVVVGLGTMGSAALEALARRGLRVVGLDRWAPPHERGEHGGGTRIIRLAYAEGSAYVPLLRRSYELWHDLERRREARGRLLTLTGGLTLGRRSGALVSGVLNASAEHGLGCVELDAEALAERFPWFRLGEDEVAVFDPAAGVLAPGAAIGTCLALAERAGARVQCDAAVLGWSAGASGVVVRTSTGEVNADRLVLCPGAGAPALLADLKVPWRVERRLQHYWRPEGDAASFEPVRWRPEGDAASFEPGRWRPEGDAASFGPVRWRPEGDAASFEPGGFPVWMWEYAPGAIGYGLPWQEPPGGVKAAFHHANAGPDAADPVDVELGAAPGTPDEAVPVRDWLATRLPALAKGEWLGASACLYTLTPDEHFLLGQHPEFANVAVAAGFSGHGFKFLPVVGEILADLAVDGATRHPIGMFAPGRFA